MVPLGSPRKYVEGNMANLSPTIPINIYRIPDKVENMYIGADCSPDEVREYTDIFKEFWDVFTWLYEKMLGIDPPIVEHEIKTFPDAKTVQQHFHVMNPRKAPAIKAEIENLLKVGFIYLVPLT